MPARILLTGGCGFIGSHTAIDLLDAGYEVVSLDSLERSHGEVVDRVCQITAKKYINLKLNLRHPHALAGVWEDFGPFHGVIHFAAFKWVPESVVQPLLYYENNLASLWHLLSWCVAHEIKAFVFSSSCSVYGNIAQLPVREDHPLGKAESPYAYTKQVGERMIEDVIASGTDIQAHLLRYFNPVGAHPSGQLGEWPWSPPSNLVPILCEVAHGIRPHISVMGTDYPTRDGSCIRDYIHVMDIARAHRLSMDFMLSQKKNHKTAEVINLGSGIGTSVWEAIAAFEEANEIHLLREMGSRRPGDVAAIYADYQKAKSMLGWSPEYSLNDMMKHAWRWAEMMS